MIDNDTPTAAGNVPRYEPLPENRNREVAGLFRQDIGLKGYATREYQLVSRGPALGEVEVEGKFGLMFRRKNSCVDKERRMFWVTDANFEMFEMSYSQLTAAIKALVTAV